MDLSSPSPSRLSGAGAGALPLGLGMPPLPPNLLLMAAAREEMHAKFPLLPFGPLGFMGECATPSPLTYTLPTIVEMTVSLCLSTLTQRDGAINLQRTWRDITQLKQDKAPRSPCPLPLSPAPFCCCCHLPHYAARLSGNAKIPQFIYKLFAHFHFRFQYIARSVTAQAQCQGEGEVWQGQGVTPWACFPQ